MATEKSTALVKLDLPTAPIAKIDELRNQYQALADKVNLITPVQSPDYIPAMHSVSLRAVVVNSNTDVGDTYHSPSFLKSNERALTKIAILKLLQAAGGTVVESRRIDERRDHYVAEFRVVVEIPQMDGTRRRFEATKSVDYRDGSPQVSAFQPNQLKAARQFVPELAETKALLRAVRGALALKQKYTVDELARPFVVPALVPDVDMSDPEIKRMVAAKALGMTDAMYGPKNVTPALPPATQAALDNLGPELVGDGRERPEPGQTIEITVVEEDDPEDFGTPAAPVVTHPAAVCACPCGCQGAITPEIAEITKARCGSPRCGKCYPWNTRYALAVHQGLRSLEMSVFPKMDGDAAALAHKEHMEASARKGGAR